MSLVKRLDTRSGPSSGVRVSVDAQAARPRAPGKPAGILDGARHASSLTVLQSLRGQGDAANPYLKQLFAAVSPHAELAYFSWGKALFGHYDVFHVHWPEFLLREQGRSRILGYLLFAALVARLWLGRRPVVRTLHNLEPHESAGAVERYLLQLLDRRTTTWIRINTITPRRAPRTLTILHGHYRDWFSALPVPTAVSGRLLYFGLIRPYKGVESLLEAFMAIDTHTDEGASLRVVGNPSSAVLRHQIEAAVTRDARVGARLEYVDDATLAEEIGHAQLVVLPFRQMHNSGSVLLALSLDRPVLVPRNDANQALADEVGAGWVYMYDGALSAATLRTALRQVRSDTRTSSPDLSAREWEAAGQQHGRAYAGATEGERAGAR